MIPIYSLLNSTGKTFLQGFQWPAIADNNATFEDEGVATTGWTASNSTLSASGGWLRQTKTSAGVRATMTKSITFTPSNSDYLVYGKVRASYASGALAAMWFLNGSKEVSIYFGSGDANNTTLGSVSIVGTTGTSARNVASVATGLNYETTAVEFLLQFDPKFASLCCYFREGDGTFSLKARVACDWFSATQIEFAVGSGSPVGSWIEFDYVSLCKPNLMAIGDSVFEGKTAYSPNLSLNLTNYESCIWRRLVTHPALRNNFVVNKGVGGNTSTQILARISEVTAPTPRVVILEASSNDEFYGISQATRTSNIQSSVTAIKANSSCVVFNGTYGTQTGASNTAPHVQRDYMKTWWDTYRPTLTGVDLAIDIMIPLLSPSGYLDNSKAIDDVHFNVTGYADVANYASA